MFLSRESSDCISVTWYAKLLQNLNSDVTSRDVWAKRIKRFDRAAQVFVDAEILLFSLVLAYVIRIEGKLEPRFVNQLIFALPCITSARLILMWQGGVYRCLPKYFALPDVIRLAKLHSLVTVALLGFRLLYSWKFVPLIQLPLSVIALECLLSFGGLVTFRTLQRTNSKDSKKRAHPADRKRVLLYGAGSAGVSLWRQLAQEPNIEVVGFIDDDPAKIGRSVSGLSVLGNGDALSDIVAQHGVRELTITIANCGRNLLSKILSKCQELQIPAKVVPSLGDIAQGSQLGHLQTLASN